MVDKQNPRPTAKTKANSHKQDTYKGKKINKHTNEKNKTKQKEPKDCTGRKENKNNTKKKTTRTQTKVLKNENNKG